MQSPASATPYHQTRLTYYVIDSETTASALAASMDESLPSGSKQDFFVADKHDEAASDLMLSMALLELGQADVIVRIIDLRSPSGRASDVAGLSSR